MTATERDPKWMQRAIALSTLCPPSDSAYAVGAVIVDSEGAEIASGHSREGDDPHLHAEEAALQKLSPEDPRLTDATVYSTLEPCSQRRSRPRTCTQLILAARIPRAVIAWREPAVFVDDCVGFELLTEAGVEVVELPEFADAAKSVNTRVLGDLGRHQNRTSNSR